MQSDGGLVDFRRFSGLRAILSGPAGGVVGYAQTSFDKDKGKPIIGFDMGGTSTGTYRNRPFLLNGTGKLTYLHKQMSHGTLGRTSTFLKPTPQALHCRPRNWILTLSLLVAGRAWFGPTDYSGLGQRALVPTQARHVTERAVHLRLPMQTSSSAGLFPSTSRRSLAKMRTNLLISSSPESSLRSLKTILTQLSLPSHLD